MTVHEQTWVKVNTKVDKGMARIVAALSLFDGLQTLQSCERNASEEAYVFFWHGSWQQTASLVFDGLLPTLEQSGVDATGAVEVFNGSLPTAKIAFNAAALEKATAAIEAFATSSNCARNSLSVRDKEYRAQAGY